MHGGTTKKGTVRPATDEEMDALYEFMPVAVGQRIDRLALDKRLLSTEHALAFNHALLQRSAAAVFNEDAVECLAKELAGMQWDAETKKDVPIPVTEGHRQLARQRLAHKALPHSNAHAGLVARVQLGREKVMVYVEMLMPFMRRVGVACQQVLVRQVRASGGTEADIARALDDLDRCWVTLNAELARAIDLPQVFEAEDQMREELENG